MSASASAPTAPAESRGGTRIQGLPDHVVIRQLYLGCLSQASYLVGDARTGRAIAVDPRRDVDEILGAAADEGLAVEMVVETHFHADFLSGHLELAAATGAEIGFGRAGVTEFPSRALADGDVIDLGGVQVRIMETPGHTPESITLAVLPEAGADPVAVLTGDTLFIGDVGRPDLLVAIDVPAEDLGRSPLRLAGPGDGPARLDPRPPRPRRRVGVRQGAVERDGVDHRRAAAHQLRGPAHVAGRSSSTWSPRASPPRPRTSATTPASTARSAPCSTSTRRPRPSTWPASTPRWPTARSWSTCASDRTSPRATWPGR